MPVYQMNAYRVGATRKEALANGYSRYKGKPCHRGHEGLRYTHGCGCVACSQQGFSKPEQFDWRGSHA